MDHDDTYCDEYGIGKTTLSVERIGSNVRLIIDNEYGPNGITSNVRLIIDNEYGPNGITMNIGDANFLAAKLCTAATDAWDWMITHEHATARS